MTTVGRERRELHAVAKRHSWSVVQVFEDAGVSGAKGRKDRPALDDAAWRVHRISDCTPPRRGVPY
jgi:hypothetical protein